MFLLIGAAAYAVTELGRFVGRPWVRETGFNDLGLTDTVGNWGGTVVQIFLACAIFNPDRRQSFRIAAFYAAGYVVYEFVQPMLPKGVFDWGDVVGTGVGYLISLLILVAVWRRMEKESRDPESAQAEKASDRRRRSQGSEAPGTHSRRSASGAGGRSLRRQ